MANQKSVSFYTTSELAAFLKLKPRTIQKWIEDGYLKAYQFGRKYRVRGEDFDEFLEKYKAKGSALTVSELQHADSLPPIPDEEDTEGLSETP
jgi:excisionase family DNA binding protein